MSQHDVRQTRGKDVLCWCSPSFSYKHQYLVILYSGKKIFAIGIYGNLLGSFQRARKLSRVKTVHFWMSPRCRQISKHSIFHRLISPSLQRVSGTRRGSRLSSQVGCAAYRCTNPHSIEMRCCVSVYSCEMCATFFCRHREASGEPHTSAHIVIDVILWPRDLLIIFTSFALVKFPHTQLVEFN